MGPIATAATVATTALQVFSGFSSIAAGKAAARAAGEQIAYKKIEKEYVRIRANQVRADAEERLNSSLASLNAIRAARGTMDRASSTPEKELTRQGKRSQSVALTGLLAENTSIDNEIRGIRARGEQAVLGSYVSAANSFSSALRNVARLDIGGGGGKGK